MLELIFSDWLNVVCALPVSFLPRWSPLSCSCISAVSVHLYTHMWLSECNSFIPPLRIDIENLPVRIFGQHYLCQPDGSLLSYFAAIANLEWTTYSGPAVSNVLPSLSLGFKFHFQNPKRPYNQYNHLQTDMYHIFQRWVLLNALLARVEYISMHSSRVWAPQKINNEYMSDK